jgi:(p)ppGpp synthase/HD superfamily hydrolase
MQTVMGTMLQLPTMLVSARLASAFSLAVELHGDHLRKGTGVPYLTHLMAVSGLVGEHGGDEDLMIAGLLHDALEDRPDRITSAEMVRRFGWRVGRVVEGCSDCQSRPKPPWEKRKREFLARLHGESGDVKLVAAADKLHNATTLLRDAQGMGDAHWSRFNAPKEMQCWYLRSCVTALRDGWRNDILIGLEEKVVGLEKLCGVGP